MAPSKRTPHRHSLLVAFSGLCDGAQIHGDQRGDRPKSKLNEKIHRSTEMSRVNRISSRQVTAALELLGMTQAELAAAANVSVTTVTDFVQGHHRTRQTTVEAIRFALEKRGIEFINGSTPGVKLDPSKATV